MKLSQVVPWGRSFDEYQRMFDLSQADLAGPVLGCGDGPAAFNATLTGMGGQVISCDPLYRFDPHAIAQRIEQTAPTVIEQTRQHAADFVWRDIPDVDALAALRLGAMSAFLDDFRAPDRSNRYVAAALPHLPFGEGAFRLAVCSHLLFLYSEHFDTAFHADALREMARVADEARVFPLVDLYTQPSCHLEPVIQTLESQGYDVRVETVSYEFQRGGNQMLRVRPPAPARSG